MSLNDILEEIVTSCNSSKSLLNFQTYIHKKQLTTDEIRIVQKVFTKLLKEKEKENCEVMIEAMQSFIQKYSGDITDWLYVLLIQIIKRMSTATQENHTRVLQETGDLIRNLFSYRTLFQLCCKFVMDSVHAIGPDIKCHLLQFVRHLVLTSRPDLLAHNSPDFVMAISRLISWTADLKSERVRKESGRVVQKLFNLNPEKFMDIVRVLPAGFKDRVKNLLKESSVFESLLNSPRTAPSAAANIIKSGYSTTTQPDDHIMFESHRKGLPKPGFHGNAPPSVSTQELNRSHILSSSMESIPEAMVKERMINNAAVPIGSGTRSNSRNRNFATVTYSDKQHIKENFRHQITRDGNCGDSRELIQKPLLLAHQQQNDCAKLDNDSDVITAAEASRKKHRHRHKSKSQKRDDDVDTTAISTPIGNQSVESIFIPVNSHKSRRHIKHIDQSKGDVFEPNCPNMTIKDILQELSRYNERHQERKISLILLIKLIHSRNEIDWGHNFNAVISTLLETMGDNEGETRKLAVLCLQELSKVQSHRFQDPISSVVDKLISCHGDSDQGVVEAVRSCMLTLSQRLNVDTLWRTLNLAIADQTLVIQQHKLQQQPLHWGDQPQQQLQQKPSLAFLRVVIRASSPVIVAALMTETLSMLNKLTMHPEMVIRKMSIFCMLAIYSKVGDRIWPNLKDFDDKRIHLLKMYIHRLK